MPEDPVGTGAGAKARLEALLAKRGFGMRVLPAGDGHVPERLADATRGQRSVVAHAKGFPNLGDDLCAAWVEGVFSWAGLGLEAGSARDLYQRYCTLADPGELRVAMIVAVPTHPFGMGGYRHGHVGIYVGDGQVMDSVERGVRCVPLDLWYGAYGVTSEPRWGWMRGLALA